MGSVKSILFVCLGNICRSPLAEGIAKGYAKSAGLELRIESRGTGHWHVGKPPCENSQKVARINGLDISSQRARQLCQGDFTEFDIIVGLDQSNVDTMEAMTQRPIEKLGDYGHGGRDVPDPYFFEGFEGFDKVYAMIDECVKELFHAKVSKTL